VDPAPFLRIHEILRERFPRVHETLACDKVNDLSLLYRWTGKDESLEPILLMSHLDVVPIEEGTRDQWYDKVGKAQFDEQFVWGRGALDVKCGVVGILSAVEHLVTEGFQPQRTVYIAMGHDEEVGGEYGNGEMARRFADEGLRFSFVLDEGGAILSEIIPGVSAPVAFVGIAEKRYAECEIVAIGEGGHGSMPGRSAISNLAEAIRRIEQQPMPTRMTVATATLFDFVGPEMPLPLRTVVGNRGLLEPLLTWQLARGSTTSAVVRSTINVTQVSSNSVSNANPTQAYATLNIRLLPGDTIEDVQNHLNRITADLQSHDHRSGKNVAAIKFEWMPIARGDLVSPTDCDEFRQIQKSIHEVFPDVTVAAGLTSVSTDSSWYYGVTDKVYRFIPMRVAGTDVARIHGINERIGIENMGEIARFFAQLLRNTATNDESSTP
jgi:carboxypeptidase PM20D1